MKFSVRHTWWHSPSLGYDIGMNIYGESGIPFLVFPAQEGNHRNWEDFGMIRALGDYLAQGKLQLFTVDSVDAQSWAHPTLPPSEKGIHYEKWVGYIVHEVVPFIRQENPIPPWTTGCSMGAYHAANFYFRFPRIFRGVIALSGLYDLRHFIGDYVDDTVYYNSPLYFLPNLYDSFYLDPIRQGRIIVCTGQGAWEEEMIQSTRELQEVLKAKAIPARIEFWGSDVHHDWPWWHRQMRYFLEDEVLALHHM
ncbi:MAG: esterase family protein [Bacteroidia bacterium]